MRGLFALRAACGFAVSSALACGQTDAPACGPFTNDPSFEGSDAWVRSTSDPKCCAPEHNRFIVPADAAADGPTCPVQLGGGVFEDDAGVGETFPLGTRVNLTYCNTFYEGTPQDCFCAPNADASPTWSCGI